MFSGSQLFLLESVKLKQIINDLTNFEIGLHQWCSTTFEKLHQTYMKHTSSKELTMSILNYLHGKKSSLFELYNLLYKFKIIEKNIISLDENDFIKIRTLEAIIKCIRIRGLHRVWS